MEKEVEYVRDKYTVSWLRNLAAPFYSRHHDYAKGNK